MKNIMLILVLLGTNTLTFAHHINGKYTCEWLFEDGSPSGYFSTNTINHTDTHIEYTDHDFTDFLYFHSIRAGLTTEDHILQTRDDSTDWQDTNRFGHVINENGSLLFNGTYREDGYQENHQMAIRAIDGGVELRHSIDGYLYFIGVCAGGDDTGERREIKVTNRLKK